MERPTVAWRESVAREAAAVAAGTLDPDDAAAAVLWPDEMIRDTDEVLNGFDADVDGLVAHRWEPATDEEIFEVVRRTVLALNAVGARYEIGYETGEREQLCEYVERGLEEAGIDVDAFAARHRMTRHEITDEWRTW